MCLTEYTRAAMRPACGVEGPVSLPPPAHHPPAFSAPPACSAPASQATRVEKQPLDARAVLCLRPDGRAAALDDHLDARPRAGSCRRLRGGALHGYAWGEGALVPLAPNRYRCRVAPAPRRTRPAPEVGALRRRAGRRCAAACPPPCGPRGRLSWTCVGQSDRVPCVLVCALLVVWGEGLGPDE